MATILVIDDDDFVRQTTCAILRTAGHTVDSAANGRLGIDKLNEQHFALVITDILMPDQEGLETIREIRQRDHRIGIVVMSGGNGSAGIDFFAAALVFGADATLAKPFTRRQILDCVGTVLAQHQARSA